MISSTDLLAENYFLISLLGGDNNEKSLWKKLVKKGAFIV